jgi:hypothetical protein
MSILKDFIDYMQKNIILKIVFCKRRLNGAEVLRMRPEKSRLGITVGVAQ